MRLLCPPQTSAVALVAAVEAACLSFPAGFSLENEGPCPARPEATAPYVTASAYLPAALARVISGPLLDHASDAEAANGSSCHASRLVVVETVGPSRFLLAEQRPLFASHLFVPERFCDLWRSRPFPDYSAALEPLAALALVSIGLRVHGMLNGVGAHRPGAVLDPCCGTGTVSAAVCYCMGSWRPPLFAGDISERMARRTSTNLEKFFPGDVAFVEEAPDHPTELAAPVGTSDDDCGSGAAPRGMRSSPIRVRHWDACQRWPLPALRGATSPSAEGGRGLLVVGNLPWGGSLAGKEEDAAGIVRCLAKEFPLATLCLIVPEVVRQECLDAGSVHILREAPVGKKAALLVLRGQAP
mmetsp:Transcript_122907/g.319609  ORF Transcript_122907/g.319609 Transcript_122907/m.319609 type:complete len:356 (+) Transcript_122907:2-1069(+)